MVEFRKPSSNEIKAQIMADNASTLALKAGEPNWKLGPKGPTAVKQEMILK